MRRGAWENLSIRRTLKELENAESGFHWIVIRSADLSGKCECLNEQVPRNHESPDPSCKRCLGTGYVFTDYLAKGLQYSQTRQFRGEEIQMPAGVLNNSNFRYALNIKEIVPKTTDLLIEIELNKNTGDPVTPIKVQEVYDIQHVRRLWGDQGREEYYSLNVEQRQIYPGTFSRGQGRIK